MNNYSFSTYPITNASSIQWTTGQATASIIAGTFNSASPVFNPTTATTVNPGGNVSITLNVQAKIDVAVIDEVRTSVSYLMPSVDQTRRYFYIEFFWIPYNGYMLAYNSNG
ncbi:MAG: hypothetical protein LBF15_03600 [Candidatus Peribacteria bacterium]|jgi:hypothetical protein|nr:hypothetical protein [Candidatus Peribacteria bacterium]